MDWKFSFTLITVLFAMATGWQLALFVSPQEYSLAGWVVCGAGTLLCLVGAAGKGGQ
jgi:hypothetical protein